MKPFTSGLKGYQPSDYLVTLFFPSYFYKDALLKLEIT